MKLGIAIDPSLKKIQIPLEKIKLAESLGFDSIWTAEAYGTDAITPLAFIAAHTKNIRLGTSIAQVSARTPAATAMAFNTLDQLAGEGRAICGLGLSGPQVIEGWHGQAWDLPYHRMKDTVSIIKRILQRDAPVEYQGKAYSLPYCETDSADGLTATKPRFGKPLKSIAATNADLPILLATGSESMVKLTAEISDGWIPFGFAPGDMAGYQPWLEQGFARAIANGQPAKDLNNFEIYAPCIVCLTDDVKAEIQQQKSAVAFYVGGMGHQQKNFHKDRMTRAGYQAEAEKIQQLFLDGQREAAVDIVPDEFIDNAALIGSKERIVERLKYWQSSGATGLILNGADKSLMKLIADYFQG